MLCDKDRIAQELIDWHFKVEPETSVVYRFLSVNEDSPEEPVKLLEVNDETPETGRVDAFRFSPNDEVPYPTVIAVVTRREMKQIESGAMKLPLGWDLSKAQIHSRPRRQRAA